MLFADANAARAFAARLANKLDAPFVNARASTLGGDTNCAVMLCVSLDARDTWANGIMENSRYFRVSIANDGAIEQFTLSGIATKFRKSRVKTLDDVIAKLVAYLLRIAADQVDPNDCEM